MPQITEPRTTEIVARYMAVWSEPWAARVILFLAGNGRILEDYQLTVKPLAG
jgi:hypothetical protein